MAEAKGTTSTAVAKAEVPTGVVNIKTGFTSYVGNDLATRKEVFKAVQESEPLADHLNEPLHIVNILSQPVETENEQTGVLEEYTRVTLVDADGKAYHAGSNGLVLAVQNMVNIFGHPAIWEEALSIKVVEKKAARGKFFTVELAD